MIPNNEYIDFDLKSLFFYILRRWKCVVAFILAFSLLAGIFQTYSKCNPQMFSSMESNYQEEYQKYQEQFDLLSNRINFLQEKYDAKEEYLRDSVLMNIDYRNIACASATYYIDVENLEHHYRKHLKDFDFLEKISADVGIEAKYLRELITTGDPEIPVLTISVIHSSLDVAETILAALQEDVTLLHGQLVEAVGEHTVSLATETSGFYVDDELFRTQYNNNESLMDMQSDLISYRKSLNGLSEPTHPSAPIVSKTFIEWAVIGGALGAILAVVFLLLLCIVRNRLHSPSQLVACFGSTLLGEAIVSAPRLSKLSRLINRMEGCLTENSESNLLLLAENIRSHCGDFRNILLWTDADAKVTTALADQLNPLLDDVKLLPVGDPLKDADALRSLAHCDAVLTVAARDVSRNAEIRKVLELIGSRQKEMVGFIVTF